MQCDWQVFHVLHGVSNHCKKVDGKLCLSRTFTAGTAGSCAEERQLWKTLQEAQKLDGPARPGLPLMPETSD